MAKNLTASKLLSFKETGKDYRLADGNGLYIKVFKKILDLKNEMNNIIVTFCKK